MMRLLGLAAVLALVALAATAIPAAAKAPFEVTVYEVATGEVVAILDQEQDLLEWTEGLFAMDAELPASAMPESWDYRFIAYWDAARQHPQDLFYQIPRDGHLGIVYWPDWSPGDPSNLFLHQSKAFDTFMARYTGILPPGNPTPLTQSDTGGSASSPWPAVAVAAVVVASGAAVTAFLWRRARRESSDA